MTAFQKLVPDFLSWTAEKNCKTFHNQIEDDNTKNADVDAEIHGSIALPGWNKDAPILKEDREFDKDHQETIDYGGSHGPLNNMVRILSSMGSEWDILTYIIS